MKSVLGKAVRKEFTRKFEERFPQAISVPPTAAVPGSRAWRLRENANAAAYLVLNISVKEDNFTIEIAWSRRKTLPTNVTFGPSIDRDAEEVRFRHSRLWHPHGGEIWYDLQYDDDVPKLRRFYWGVPDAETLARVPIKVARALDDFERYGIPYLRETVRLPLNS